MEFHRLTVSVVLTAVIYLLVIPFGIAQSVLYVTPNTTTPCPADPCHTISEYAEDLSALESNSTLIFLPGEHALIVNFRVFGDTCPNCSRLALAALKPEMSTRITCADDNDLYFTELTYLRLSGLAFSSCGGFIFPSIAVQFVPLTEIENCTFTNNKNALVIDHGKLISTGNTFINASSTILPSGAVQLVACNATFTHCLFSNNSAGVSGGAIYALTSIVELVGTNIFEGNRAMTGGAISAISSKVIITGFTTFAGNRAVMLGGALYVSVQSNITFETIPVFVANSAQYGGAIAILNGEIEFIFGMTTEQNMADYGGAVYATSSTLTLHKNSTITANEALSGGGMFLASNAMLFLAPNTSVFFSNNYAETEGGAIYVQDVNSLVYCIDNVNQNCFYQFTDFITPTVLETGSRLYFEDNFAEEAGNSVFGGAVDLCTLVSGALSFPDPGAFDILAVITHSNDSMNKEVSSNSLSVCACSEDGEIICDIQMLHRTVVSGGNFTVSVVGVGQRSGVVTSVIQALNTSVHLSELEFTKTIPSRCTDLTYTVFGTPGNGTVELYTEGPCLTLGASLPIQVQILPCPPGLSQTASSSCECEERLQEFTDTCSATDGTILRDGDFWVGYDSQQEGLILHPHCPFSYCTSRTVTFRVEDSDAQCRDRRMGLLCGGCREGFSLLLGSSQCDRCSNTYLLLLIFFALAGVLLVAFLLICRLTVSTGSINGLVFYANVIAANKATFFPQQSNGYVDILKVFIAWINLDFGIETCFYDGMDAYARTWLQFVFPLYIWAIIGLLILASKFVPRVGRLLGTNPVAVLATLVLLSYAKLLRTIISAFSFAKLEYPQGDERVWLDDGNVPFLEGKHIALFIVSLLFLLLDFIPYTLLLLTSQWLQRWSDWKILSWLNNLKVRTFLDAYHAPYKPKHRYWTGLLLLVRFAILLTSALNSKVDPGINLIVIGILLVMLQTLTWNFGGIYKHWYIEALESFYLVNLGLLTLATFHIELESASSELTTSEANDHQVVAISILITAALVVFVGIVAVHIYWQLRRIGIFGTVKWRKDTRRTVANESTTDKVNYRIHTDTVVVRNHTPPTKTVVELREELLEDHEMTY